MRSNHWQSWYGITTFGESHGKAVGVVLDDVIPGIRFPLTAIQDAVNRRKSAGKPGATSRHEADTVEVLSGVFEGKTTGTPICLLVQNTDAHPRDYQSLEEIFRPGHGDFSWFSKFKIFDHRGGGRASGRETLARVAAASLADSFLGAVSFHFATLRIGSYASSYQDAYTPNPLHWPDADTLPDVLQYLEELQSQGNSVGGIIQCVISGVPAGLGDPVFEKLEANLAKAVLSIGSIKGIEFGDGFALGALHGSQANDQMDDGGFLSNHNGGILGGISTGEKIVFRCVIKPTPSIGIPQRTANRQGDAVSIQINGRHDTCIIPRIIPVIEAMCKLVLADAIAHQRLISGESATLAQLRESIDKIDEDILMALYRRMQISAHIGALKAATGAPIFDGTREEMLFASLHEKARLLNLSPTTVEAIWHAILWESKAHQ